MNPEELNQRLAKIEERQKAILGNQKVIISWQQQFDLKPRTKSFSLITEQRKSIIYFGCCMFFACNNF